MASPIDEIQVKIIYSKRRSISVEIKPEGILVRAPKGMSRRAIYNFLAEKQDWIEKHWKKIQERREIIEQLPRYTEEELKVLVQKAKLVIPPKVEKYASMVGVDYGRITIRKQRSRWGSCSSKGNLNFNCLLMLFPDAVIDSVVVHELCHRKHMNHSAAFYAEVERVFPEYRKCNKWLKDNGEMYLRRLT